MTERARRKATWGSFTHTLTNAVQAEKGKIACLDTSTGLLTKAGTSTTLKPIGYFKTSVLGDGTLTVEVDLFDEIEIHFFANDTGTAVVAADIGSPCYLKDDVTVSGDNTGRSTAGQVWGVSTLNGVAVQMVGF